MNSEENSSAGEPERFLNVNAMTNALDYLESAANFIERSDDFKWKWAAIALHHALYSFCVISLEHGDPNMVLRRQKGQDDEGEFWQRGNVRGKTRRKYLDAGLPAYRIERVETDEEPPTSGIPQDDFAWATRTLVSLWTALARIQDGEWWMARYVDSKPVTITDEDLKAIRWLGLKVRNELIHFIPKHSGISIEGIRCGCLAALTVIESLVFESNTIWLIDEDGRDRIKKAIAGLRDGLAAHTRIS